LRSDEIACTISAPDGAGGDSLLFGKARAHQVHQRIGRERAGGCSGPVARPPAHAVENHAAAIDLGANQLRILLQRRGIRPGLGYALRTSLQLARGNRNRRQRGGQLVCGAGGERGECRKMLAANRPIACIVQLPLALCEGGAGARHVVGDQLGDRCAGQPHGEQVGWKVVEPVVRGEFGVDVIEHEPSETGNGDSENSDAPSR
jgi:hypothetical protein